MTTIVATFGHLFADKRTTAVTTSPLLNPKTDTTTKIFVPIHKPSFITNPGTPEEKVNFVEVMAGAGNVKPIQHLIKIIESSSESLNLIEVFQEYVDNRINVFKFSILGLTTEGYIFFFEIGGGVSIRSNENKNVFWTIGSGASFDLDETWEMELSDVKKKFLALCYMDDNSTTSYNHYDFETKTVEECQPTDEVVKEAVDAFFNPHFYTGPKKIFS